MMAKSKENMQKSIAYKDGLTNDEKQRYEGKLSIVGGLDPYEEKLSWTQDVNVLPTITYPDIVNYLLFTPSPYTKDDLKAYKSLEAYNQFVCGWVRDKVGIVHGQHVIVMAKVLHSQRMREKPLRPWIIATKDGNIVSCHCNCMAGLGEACTHVASLLFAIEATVKVRDAKTVTESKAYWLLPSDCKSVSYQEVRDIDFVSAKTAKKQLDQKLESLCASTPAISETPLKKSRNVPEATAEDFMAFAEQLSKLNSKPAILSLVPPFAQKYVPKSDTDDFPTVLTELKNEKVIGACYTDVLHACANIEIKCSTQQAANVEEQTKKQANSVMWHRFRAGRVTASNAKAVVKTNKSDPSQSLVKSICYPDSNGFTSLATKWGRDNEKRARDVFMNEIGPVHDNSMITDSGLVISQTHPFIGASPDGVFTCDCCGAACIEIKCPYSIRSEELNSETCDFLKETDGQLHLDKNHQYYYQIQTQMGVTRMERCFFVVWTERNCHIEAVMFDEGLWQTICEEAEKFFKSAILPELVGKFYTTLPGSVLKSVDVNKKVVTDSLNCYPTNMSDETLYCLCSQVEHGKMIACDNTECKIEWFHYRCVKIEKPPKGKWYCPDCRRLQAFKRKRIV